MADYVAQTITTNAEFIPEMWSDEVLAVYKKSLVAVPFVKKLSFVGKKGDTIHVPKPGRGVASLKAAGFNVTEQVDTATTQPVVVDKHYEYSRYIEDFAEVQSLASARAFYTDDAGYALSKQVDTSLLANVADLQGGSTYDAAVIGGDGSTVWDDTANTNTGNGSNLTDIGIRNAIQLLEDADVPSNDWVLLINPGQKNVLLGIDRFNSRDFSKTQGVNTGLFGEVYGIPVHTTTNLATVSGAVSGDYKVCVLMQKEAIVFAEQMAIRSQTQYEQKKLATLYTADTIYGTDVYRTENGVGIIVPV